MDQRALHDSIIYMQDRDSVLHIGQGRALLTLLPPSQGALLADALDASLSRFYETALGPGGSTAMTSAASLAPSIGTASPFGVDDALRAPLLHHLLSCQQEAAAAGSGRVVSGSPSSAAAVLPHALLGTATASLLHLTHAIGVMPTVPEPNDRSASVSRADDTTSPDASTKSISTLRMPKGLERWRAGVSSAFLLRTCLADAMAAGTSSGISNGAAAATSRSDTASPDTVPLALIQAALSRRIEETASALMISRLSGVASALLSDPASGPPAYGGPSSGDPRIGAAGARSGASEEGGDFQLPDLIPYELDGSDDGFGLTSGLEDDDGGFSLEGDELGGQQAEQDIISG